MVCDQVAVWLSSGDSDDDDDDNELFVVCQRRDAEMPAQHGHHVAGLRAFHDAAPVAHSDWPRLPSSNLETDQSPHQQ